MALTLTKIGKTAPGTSCPNEGTTRYLHVPFGIKFKNKQINITFDDHFNECYLLQFKWDTLVNKRQVTIRPQPMSFPSSKKAAAVSNNFHVTR